MKLKLGVVLGIALGLSLISSKAQALTWTLNNVTFNDGATATGFFDYNASQSTYSNVNITLSLGTIFNNQNFSTSNLNFQASTAFSVCSNGSGCSNSKYIYLGFSSTLSNTPRTLNVSGYSYGLTDNSGNIISSSYSSIKSGTVSGTAVPWEFSQDQGVALGLPLFIGLRILKKRQSIKS